MVDSEAQKPGFSKKAGLLTTDSVRRDSLLTIVGLAALVVIFLFGVYLPGNQDSASIEREIAQAEQSIRDIPLRVAELESLTVDVQARNDYLDNTSALIPRNADQHAVLRQVAELARTCELTVTRLEPLPAQEHESYERMPFQLSFNGPFRGIAAFLHGLEGRGRLFTVEEITLSSEEGRNGEDVQGEVYFSGYVRRTENSDSVENNASSSRLRADRERR